MRLLLSIATFLIPLLVEEVTQTQGFSILSFPTFTTSFNIRRTPTSTSIALSAPTVEKSIPKAVELPQKDDEYDDFQIILSTLEKYLKEGPGSLSVNEVQDFETRSDRILSALKQTRSGAAEELRNAIKQLDADKVSGLLETGLEMDEATTNAAFWAVVEAVDKSEELDQPLSADVPRMLHHIFDADMRHLLSREQLRTNLTCMQPDLSADEEKARSMNYIFDDSAHKDLPLKEGRRCEGGNCCEACSRNIFPTFASRAETCFETFPELTSFTFNDLKIVSNRSILQFVRLVERVRRTIAYEYGLPLSNILPLQAYSRKYVAGTTQKGGGGGEGDFVTLHTDESTHSGYHYSCVLYLNSQGEEFEGGDFVFNDPADKESTSTDNEDEDDEYMYNDVATLAEKMRRAGRKLLPFHPTRGSAVIFSSGWENMHEVETITSGTRFTVPCFFTTCPVPEAAYEHMVVGKPKTDKDIAEDWLHLLLAHRQETPLESTGRVKELLMKWHYMCTPLSEHSNQ